MKKSLIKKLVTTGLRDTGYSIDIEKAIQATTYIIPEPATYLSSHGKNMSLNYIAPIRWKGFNSVSLPTYLTKSTSKKRIYITFGGTGFDVPKLVGMSTKLVKKGYEVTVTTGPVAEISDFPKHKNLHVYKYLPGTQVLDNVDLMICHGGYNTMVDAVERNIPIIAVPFNPDQVLHSLRFQELGLATCLTNFGWKDIVAMTQYKFDDFQKVGISITLDEIITKVPKILKQAPTTKNPFILDKNKNGAGQAADIIESGSPVKSVVGN